MDWHSRFVQQAGWTLPLRRYLFDQAALREAARVLEVGCGTGAVLYDLTASAHLHGLDLDFARLREARTHAPRAALTCANGLALPYPTGIFDLTFCHFYLMWVPNPLAALLEMKRVTRPGGSLLALAEPDHSRRVDEPASLEPLGRWQTQALRQQGADPALGGRLEDLFRQAGIACLETGCLKEEPALSSPANHRLEWEVLESDLRGRVPEPELQKMKELEAHAWQSGQRRIHVPTHFAWGKA